MKANKAPEKIYIDVSLDSAWGMTERSYDNEVEYIRTDVFIEKAIKYIANPFLAPGMDNEIEDFKNYMKGE